MTVSGIGNAATVLLSLALLFSAFAGCFGKDENSTYAGPIDIVLVQSDIEGTISLTKSSGNNTVQQNNFSISFDLSATTSGSGDIVAFSLDPGDGTGLIVTDANEDSVIEHEYSMHGVFEVLITANDSAGNERTITSMVHMGLLQEYNEQSSNSPDVVWVDAHGPSSAAPTWINLTSIVENNQGVFVIGDQRPVDVTWKLFDGTGSIVTETTETIDDGESFEFTTDTEMPADADWRLEITLSNDVRVDADSTFGVSYPAHG